MRFENIPGCCSLGRLKIFNEIASDEIKDRKPRSKLDKVFHRLKKVDETSELSDSQHRGGKEEDCCWVCMDAVEVMLEARAKTVHAVFRWIKRAPTTSTIQNYTCPATASERPSSLSEQTFAPANTKILASYSILSFMCNCILGRLVHLDIWMSSP